MMRMFSIAQKTERRVLEKHGVEPESKRYAFSTVALIGPDGSGKSSIAKNVIETSSLPIKYIYMGANVDSSNIALPTSRLIHKWKVKRHKKKLQKAGKAVPKKISLHGLEHRIDNHGKAWGVGRLLRRISEEVYRQIVSYAYQMQGYVVLYDRHFLFDACPVPEDIGKQRMTDRIHCWFLRKLYPRPGLVIMLDAPVDVLYSRKQEVPVDYLENCQKSLLRKKCYADNFVTVSTDTPFEDTVDKVNCIISEYCANRCTSSRSFC